jgi:hypothetical protein
MDTFIVNKTPNFGMLINCISRLKTYFFEELVFVFKVEETTLRVHFSNANNELINIKE